MSMRTKRSNEAEIQTTESEVPLVKPREHEPLQYLETSLPITSLQSVAEASASAATALGDDNEGHSHANESESRSITIPAPISTSPLSIPGVSTIGISELYNPSSETTIVADVVFVHGIMGHPVDTWLYGKIPKTKAEKTGEWSLASVLRSLASALTPWRQRTEGWTSGAQEPKRSYCYWPFQLLPQDVKDMRILTYGYDSHPTHWYKGETNRMTITQHAESLLTELTLNRSECRGRPLIFVAHSLGGILVKSALNESLQMQLNQAQPAYADLQKSCHAVIFFGTPHLGASIAAFGEMVSNVVGALPGGFSTYGEVLRGLSPDSETLYNISRRFNDLLNAWIPASEKIQICSIQEGKGMTSVKGLDSKVERKYL